MNILYLNHYAGSPQHGMEYRPYYLAREWVRGGHTVRMVAASFSHVRATQPDMAHASSQAAGKTAGKPVIQNIDGIDYHWYAAPAYSGNGLGRVKNIAAFLWQVWRDAPAIAAQFAPDVVIASSTYPMDIWVAHRIARLARKRTGKPCKLVYEVHDLWPLSPIELGGMSPRHPFIMLCQAGENYAYKHADVVISMLPKVAEHMQSHGLDLQKLHIVPNGIDPSEWLGTPEPLDASIAMWFDRLRKMQAHIVGYAGAHGVANALETLINAGEQLHEQKVHIVMVGTGTEKEKLEKYAADRNLQNVHFLAPVPKKQIPSLLKQFDVAYIGLQNQPLFRFGIAPNKLMDYMMAELPIVMAIQAGNDPVSESGCGLTVAPEDADSVTHAIQTLLTEPLATRIQRGAQGRKFVLDNHTYPVLAARFLQACQSD